MKLIEESKRSNALRFYYTNKGSERQRLARERANEKRRNGRPKRMCRVRYPNAPGVEIIRRGPRGPYKTKVQDE
jgi:hypothetical protein